jgi:hypothetical protein
MNTGWIWPRQEAVDGIGALALVFAIGALLLAPSPVLRPLGS